MAWPLPPLPPAAGDRPALRGPLAAVADVAPVSMQIASSCPPAAEARGFKTGRRAVSSRRGACLVRQCSTAK